MACRGDAWLVGTALVMLAAGAACTSKDRGASETPSEGAAKDRLDVRSEPAGAAIWLDGKDTGKVTPADLDPAPGTHSLTLRHAGFSEETVTVFISRIMPPAPVEVSLGVPLHVRSEPAGATVRLDREPARTTPADFILRAVGPHRLVVSSRGFATEWRDFEVSTLAARQETFALRPGADLVVVSAPMGAEVVLDGKPTGERTPASLAVPAGVKLALSLKKEGHLEVKRTIAPIGRGQTEQVDLVLPNLEADALSSRIEQLELKLGAAERELVRLERSEELETMVGSVAAAKVARRRLDEARSLVESLARQVASLKDEREAVLGAGSDAERAPTR